MKLKVFKILKDYKLYKKFKPYNIKKICKTPKINSLKATINISNISNQEFSNEIYKFIYTVNKNIEHNNLTFLYNNLNNVKVKKIKSTDPKGSYNQINNEIKASENSAIYHELFHLSSSFIDHPNKNIAFLGLNNIINSNIFCAIYSNFKCKCFCGFSQNKKGIGLTEGYTQLLAERYFNAYTDRSYSIEVYICKKLEQIVGKEKMEELYFNANLYGLINELKKYDTDDNIMKFITQIDLLHNVNNEKNILKFKQKMIHEYLKNISNSLLKWYIKKLKFESSDFSELDAFLLTLKGNLLFKDIKYEILNFESIIKVIDTANSEIKAKTKNL